MKGSDVMWCEYHGTRHSVDYHARAKKDPEAPLFVAPKQQPRCTKCGWVIRNKEYIDHGDGTGQHIVCPPTVSQRGLIIINQMGWR